MLRIRISFRRWISWIRRRLRRKVGPSRRIVTAEQAVGLASEQPAVSAGASRVGALRIAWPALARTSGIIDGKVRNFVESRHGQANPIAGADQLADFLVLSTCAHTFDGWRYISRAALALLDGARNNAIHLAYYAELRAALSILAGSGIAVLNYRHFSLDQIGDVHWFNGKTHEVAWECLREWSKLPANALRVINCFESSGLTAAEWAEASAVAPSLQSIANDWLSDWSVDLSSVRADSLLRNESTYPPDLRASAYRPASVRELKLIRDISSVCEFTGAGDFGLIDAVLMYDLCRKACEIKHGKADPCSMQHVWGSIFAWLRANKRMSQEDAMDAIKSLKRAITSAGNLLSHAEPTNRNVVGIISRAFLLLRLSSALLRRQWLDMRVLAIAGKSAWQDEALVMFGECSNLWPTDARPTTYGMLDADRIAAEDAVTDWLRQNRIFRPYTMWNDVSAAIHGLCRFEPNRVAWCCAMKYMGSKRAMLQNGLGALLDQELKAARRFVDLFAGSGAVSLHVAQRLNIPVISVDIQSYSAALTNAVISRDRPFACNSSLNCWISRAAKYRQTFPKLRLQQVTSKTVFATRILCERSGLPITKAYGGHYFSFEQAVWIDSLRRCLPKSEPANAIALAALIQAASECAAAPGHTAQPFQPSSRAIRFLAEAWSRDVVGRTRKAFISISRRHAQCRGHAEVNDANAVAKSLRAGDVAFVDPPYSDVHYSRFYHVLETIARGRCEFVSGVGRYPPPLERPRSSYSVVTESKGALTDLLETIASRRVRTILTFPLHNCSNGLSGKTVRRLASRYFHLKQKQVKSVFSSLGGIGEVGTGAARRRARMYTEEFILVLDPK